VNDLTVSFFGRTSNKKNGMVSIFGNKGNKNNKTISIFYLVSNRNNVTITFCSKDVSEKVALVVGASYIMDLPFYH
jgi:hypothetical protein